jgi:hypothetical protein
LSDTFFHNENVGKTNTGNVHLIGFAFTFEYYPALALLHTDLDIECSVALFVRKHSIMACSLFR